MAVVVLTNVSSVLGEPTSHRIADGVARMLAGALVFGVPRLMGFGWGEVLRQYERIDGLFTAEPANGSFINADIYALE